jgi:hypothetical protein
MLSEEAIGSVFILRDTCEALILDLCRWLYSQSRFYHRHWDDRREFTRTTISNYALKRSGRLEADASWLCEFREQIKMRWHSSFFTRSDPQWWKSRIANRKWSYNALLEGRSEGKRAWVNLERENWINFISLKLPALSSREPSLGRNITRGTTLGTTTSAGTSFHQVTDTAIFKETFCASIWTHCIFYSSTATTLTAATRKSSCLLHLALLKALTACLSRTELRPYVAAPVEVYKNNLARVAFFTHFKRRSS